MTLGIFDGPNDDTTPDNIQELQNPTPGATPSIVGELLGLQTITYPGVFPGDTELRSWIIDNNLHLGKPNESFHILFKDGTRYSVLISETPVMDVGETRDIVVTFYPVSPRN